MARLGRPPKVKRGRPLGSKNKKTIQREALLFNLNSMESQSQINEKLSAELLRLSIEREIKKLKAPWYKRFFI